MRVKYINNDGGGFSDWCEIGSETTIEAFLRGKIRDFYPGDYRIRVNREDIVADYILRDGDRISCTPKNIKGARS